MFYNAYVWSDTFLSIILRIYLKRETRYLSINQFYYDHNIYYVKEKYLRRSVSQSRFHVGGTKSWRFVPCGAFWFMRFE